jgi:hypothetical protein
MPPSIKKPIYHEWHKEKLTENTLAEKRGESGGCREKI